MISCKLDDNELMFLLKGCAMEPQLGYTIWFRMVEEWIPRMKQSQLDFIWWSCMRDLWPIYFGQSDKPTSRYGASEFLHMMAALNRSNHCVAVVRADDHEMPQRLKSYRYGGQVYQHGSWTPIPKEYVITIKTPSSETLGKPLIPSDAQALWRDRTIYDAEPPTLLGRYDLSSIISS